MPPAVTAGQYTVRLPRFAGTADLLLFAFCLDTRDADIYFIYRKSGHGLNGTLHLLLYFLGSLRNADAILEDRSLPGRR